MVARTSTIKKAAPRKAVAKKTAAPRKTVAKKAAPAPVNNRQSNNRQTKRNTNDLVGRVGNLGGDPELRYAGNGMAVCVVSLAYQPYNPETKEQGDTVWYRLIGFNQMADQMAASLQTGMRVVVSGRPQLNEWTDEEGLTHAQKEIIVDGIGPDIRFANVNVYRAERKGPARQGVQPNMYDDEEPF